MLVTHSELCFLSPLLSIPPVAESAPLGLLGCAPGGSGSVLVMQMGIMSLPLEGSRENRWRLLALHPTEGLLRTLEWPLVFGY